MNKKAVSEIIGVISVTLISVVIIGSTFFWAIQLIENNRKYSAIRDSENIMIEISKGVDKVIHEKNQYSVDIELKESQLLYVTNTSIILSNLDAFSTDSLSGNRYLIGDEDTCSADNISIDKNNICIVQKYLNKLEFFYIDVFTDGKLYGVEFEVEGSGSATKGPHTVFIKYGGAEETSERVNNKIRISIK